MPEVLVCSTTILDSTEEVLGKLGACKGAEEAYMVRGVYDIVVKINSKSVDDLEKVSIDGVLGAGKIQKTLTIMVVAG